MTKREFDPITQGDIATNYKINDLAYGDTVMSVPAMAKQAIASEQRLTNDRSTVEPGARGGMPVEEVSHEELMTFSPDTASAAITTRQHER